LGNSDAFWLFQDANPNIQLPSLFFEDYLGRGFSGDIHGKRTKINSVQLGSFKLNKPIIALPDSTSIKSVNMVKDRLGSIGGGILKRFTAIFDYPNGQLFIKKASTFEDIFHYNRSGIEIINSGLQWVPETVRLATTYQDNTFYAAGNRSGSANFQYKFELKAVFEIANVRVNSPAKEAGLQKGDILEAINNSSINSFTLQQINVLLQSEEGKTLYFEINRNGKTLKIKFQTKELL
jgi:membrane-associated protease RseP (regulator of RpoE activity)